MFDKEFGLLITVPDNFSGIAMGITEYSSIPISNRLAYSTAYTIGSRVSTNGNGGKQLTIELNIDEHEIHLSNDNYTVI